MKSNDFWIAILRKGEATSKEKRFFVVRSSFLSPKIREKMVRGMHAERRSTFIHNKDVGKEFAEPLYQIRPLDLCMEQTRSLHRKLS